MSRVDDGGERGHVLGGDFDDEAAGGLGEQRRRDVVVGQGVDRCSEP